MKSLLALLLLVSRSLSQEPYRVPFTSKGNTLELTVANTSPVAANDVSVEATGMPSWINFNQKTEIIDQLKAKEV